MAFFIREQEAERLCDLARSLGGQAEIIRRFADHTAYLWIEYETWQTLRRNDWL